MSKPKEVELEQDDVEGIDGEAPPTMVVDPEADDEKEVVRAAPPAGHMSRRERDRIEREEREARNEARHKEMMAAFSALLAARQEPAAAHRVQQQAPDVNPDMDRIRAQRRLLVKQLQKPNLSESESERIEAEFERLYEEQTASYVRKYAPQTTQGMSEVDVGRVILANEYPEIYANPHAAKSAELEYHLLLAQGQQAGISTAKMACQNVKEKLGLGAKTESDGQRAKYTGVGSKPAGGTASGPRKVTLSKGDMRMAREYAKGRAKDDNEAASIYIKEVLLPAGVV
jgi:hypothetical protein